MSALVIYHASCVDGFTAAWAFHRCAAWSGAEFVAAHYGDPPPDVTGRDVAIVDFSYPRDLLVEMHAKAASLVVLDHHKTAEAALAGLGFCTFDMKRSGAALAWDHCFPGTAKGRAALVNYVQDRDLWAWALPDSREISAYISTIDRTFEAWDELHCFLVDRRTEAVERGRIVLRVTEQYVEHLRTKGRLVDFDGHEVPVINTTFAASELIGALAEGRPFAIGWFQREDGAFVYSLRSRGDGGEDVSAIAKRYGGGGHRNAAGFTLDYLLTFA